MGTNANMIKYYRDLNQKRQLVLDAKSRGETLMHTDFIDISGRKTKGENGRLTFEVLPPTLPYEIKSLDELNLLLFKKEISFTELLDLLTIQALSPTRWQRFKAMFTP